MRIIKDEQKQINLHPLVIYFIVSPEDSIERKETLNKLNKYQGFTRGLFRFQTIEHIDKTGEALSSELTDAIMNYNMFAKLIDDNTHSFYYAVNKVNFNLNADDVEISIQKFIFEVCKQNIKQLKALAADYSQKGASQAKQREVRQMQQTFHDAIAIKVYKHGILTKIMGETYMENRSKSNIMRSENVKDMPRGFMEKFEKASKNNNPQYLWSWLENYQNASTKEDADESVQGYYETKYAPSLKRNINRHTQPKEKPTVSVEIKQIVKKVLKSGKEKKEYGFIFRVNDEVFPICFGSKDQTMLYACTLLRQKMGEKLYLHEFYNNDKGKSPLTRFHKEKSQKWLKAVYNCLFPCDLRDSINWIENVEKRRARPLNQGKSQIARRLENLFETQNTGIYYCAINTREDALGDSFYDVMIEPDKIIIPNEWQFLINDFKHLMGI